MKQVFLFVMTFLLVTACGKKNDKAAIERGRILVEANDCKTCHLAAGKLVGPSHADVAKKYETTDANIEMLANKIIKGGSGVWGDIPMTAHTDISQEDAKQMARYILSLDEK
jgi:cytochrome c